MNYTDGDIISDFLSQTQTVFTVDDFQRYLKSSGVKISKSEADDILHVSDFVFSLVDQQFVTRAGAFTGRWFSFKPTKEEIDKGYFILGHRCMPFINQETNPDSIIVHNDDGFAIIPEPVIFSMNVALDVFALYGEGYVIPYIFNDRSNTKLKISSVQYSMPTEITLTAWSFKEIIGNQEIKYGDRILCRVVDWENSTVEMQLLKNEMNDFVISKAVIERENWYELFEKAILNEFDKHGPTTSIEEQLALLFLENQEELCCPNCGSVEEFMAHTSKIGFEPYGVETRIWKKGEIVPYFGKWVKNNKDDLIMSEMALAFSPQIIDAYLENSIYEASKGKTEENLDNLLDKILPMSGKISASERKLVLLNIEKRHGILKMNYNRFSDYTVAEIRKRTLELFTQVSSLLCSIGYSGLKTEEFPQQELVILTQLYAHIVRLLEEYENVFLRNQFPIDDVALSLDGMEDTFDEIGDELKNYLERNRYKGYGILENQ